jgi:transcription elongation factor Elf1
MCRRPVRPNPQKDADRRREIRAWFDDYRRSWACRFCGETFAPVLSVYADPTTCRPVDGGAKWAKDGKSPDLIRTTVEQGVILCPTCKAKLACLPTPRSRLRPRK